MIMAKTKDKKKPGEATLKNPKHELFAHLYAGYKNQSLFGNGTQCYAFAYGYSEKILKNNETIEELISSRKPGYTVKEKALKAANRRMLNVASVEATRLLANPKILERLNVLLDSVFNDADMDRELVFVAMQRKDLNSKVAAIREYNRVKDRASDKVTGTLEVTWVEPEKKK